MSLADKIQALEEEVTQLDRVVRLTERLLAELMKSTPPPAQLDKVHGFLRSARDLLKHREEETAQDLLTQAEEGLGAVRQWLAVGDLGISPFILRTFLEKNPPERELQLTLVNYFLTKQPHAENDRDKLDYLLSAYCGGTPTELEARLARPEELRHFVEPLFAGRERKELNISAEVMLHELSSLIARIEDFSDFDQLVQARMVERVRALKTNLGESFYHPRVLPTVIHFNLAFRRHFEKLFHQQLSIVRRDARQRLGDAWTLIEDIEEAYEALALAPAERAGGGLVAPEAGSPEGEPRVGRPLAVLDERPPIDRLVRRTEDSQKENELRGIISRIGRFLEKLPAEQAKSEKVVFALRHAQLELTPWEREAFLPAATGAAPESARIIQHAVGVVAWLEEELTQYQQTRDDRYLWKTHFDLLSYAVGRAGDLLKAIHELLQPGAEAREAAWFKPLLHTALRLGTTLNRVAPVFEEPAAA